MKANRRSNPVLPSSDEVERFRQSVLGWFVEHGRSFPWRSSSANQYQRVVAELLLQRTQADTVARFFPEFVQRYPSWTQLAVATDDDLESLLRPIGLWRRRTASFRRLAIAMVARGGILPRTREDLETLPGVGQYMANAVLLLCYREAQPLLDANMARVLERYFEPRQLVDIRYDPYLQALALQVVSADDPVFLNFAILDLASMICKPNRPLCPECPLLEGCRFGRATLEENAEVGTP